LSLACSWFLRECNFHTSLTQTLRKAFLITFLIRIPLPPLGFLSCALSLLHQC
jgi:hypothetical protein